MKVVLTLTKTFFDGHPKAGQPTHFAEAVRNGTKIHTCRDNYTYWAGKIEALKAAGGTLCVREWSGRPFRSPQDTIKEIPAEVVGVERLLVERDVLKDANATCCIECEALYRHLPFCTLAGNDGLTSGKELAEFIAPLFDKYSSGIIEFAIVHFTPFRYATSQTN